MQWIFAQRLAGHSTARIARALNDAGIPCPSAADPGRNPHRTGAAWTLGTVTTILRNPRYTGRQVWNRQRTDKDLADPGNVSLGHKSVQRWNLPDGWVISSKPAHPALVSEPDIIAAQDITAAQRPRPENRASGARSATVLASRAAGLRSMRAAHGIGLVQRQARLPVRYGHTSAASPDPGRPKNAYVREDRIMAHLPALHLVLTGTEPAAGRRRRRRTCRGADVRPPVSPEEAIGYLREHQITPTWDPAAGTLEAGTAKAIKTVTGKAS